jgi:hypothetical protein
MAFLYRLLSALWHTSAFKFCNIRRLASHSCWHRCAAVVFEQAARTKGNALNTVSSCRRTLDRVKNSSAFHSRNEWNTLSFLVSDNGLFLRLAPVTSVVLFLVIHHLQLKGLWRGGGYFSYMAKTSEHSPPVCFFFIKFHFLILLTRRISIVQSSKSE